MGHVGVGLPPGNSARSRRCTIQRASDRRTVTFCFGLATVPPSVFVDPVAPATFAGGSALLDQGNDLLRGERRIEREELGSEIDDVGRRHRRSGELQPGLAGPKPDAYIQGSPRISRGEPGDMDDRAICWAYLLGLFVGPICWVGSSGRRGTCRSPRLCFRRTRQSAS